MFNLTKKWDEYKSWVIFGIVSFFVIHMIVFTNYFPCWDTYGALQMDYTAMRNVGRWLFGSMSLLMHSPYDLEWIAGVLSAVFVTASSILMIDLWDIKRPVHRGIILFLVAAFPSMMATYVYMFTSAAYMLAFFLAIMGTYLSQVEKSKVSFLLSGVCLMFSLALYQIYLLTAMGVFILFLVSKMLKGTELKEIKIKIWRFILATSLGGGIYKAFEMIYKKLDHFQLSNYQGISDVGNITLFSVWNGLKNSISHAITFYFWNEHCIYRIINIILLGIIVVSAARWIFINLSLTHYKKIIIWVLCACLIPLSYGYYYISPGVEYHRVMEFGNIFIYFLPLILFEHSDTDHPNMGNVRAICNKFLRTSCVFMLIALCFYHFRNDNITYKQLEVYAERTRYETYEIINRIDEITGSLTREVAIIGFFRMESDRYKIKPIPDTVGISRSFHVVPQSFVNFASFYYSRNYYLTSQEKLDEIKETEEYKTMGTYPNGEYVKEINGILVINL